MKRNEYPKNVYAHGEIKMRFVKMFKKNKAALFQVINDDGSDYILDSPLFSKPIDTGERIYSKKWFDMLVPQFNPDKLI